MMERCHLFFVKKLLCEKIAFLLQMKTFLFYTVNSEERINQMILDDLKKKFENTEVLKGIDFTMERGQTLSIIGSSGSGKTTFLNACW